MKRIAVVLLSFVMLVSSTACKSNTSTTGNHESAAENLQDSERRISEGKRTGTA